MIYGKREHLKHFRPYKIRPSSEELPDRWETGTLNHEGLAGVSAAILYLAELGRRIDPTVETRRAALLAAYNAIQAYERELCQQLITGLLAIPGLTLYGISNSEWLDRRTPTVSFTINGHPPDEIAGRLGERGIFTWNGNFYAISLTERLGLEDKGGLVRIGLVHYNTSDEVERLLQELKTIAKS